MDFSEAAMRQRLDEVAKEVGAIEAKSKPLRQSRDAHVRRARAKEDKMNAEIAKVEEGLFDLKMEQGRLARALGGRR